MNPFEQELSKPYPVYDRATGQDLTVTAHLAIFPLLVGQSAHPNPVCSVVAAQTDDADAPFVVVEVLQSGDAVTLISVGSAATAVEIAADMAGWLD